MIRFVSFILLFVAYSSNASLDELNPIFNQCQSVERTNVTLPDRNHWFWKLNQMERYVAVMYLNEMAMTNCTRIELGKYSLKVIDLAAYGDDSKLKELIIARSMFDHEQLATLKKIGLDKLNKLSRSEYFIAPFN